MKSDWACLDIFPVHKMNTTFTTKSGKSDDMLISVPRAIRVWVRDYNEKETSQENMFILCLRATEAEQHPQGIQIGAAEGSGKTMRECCLK